MPSEERGAVFERPVLRRLHGHHARCDVQFHARCSFCKRFRGGVGAEAGAHGEAVGVAAGGFCFEARVRGGAESGEFVGCGCEPLG